MTPSEERVARALASPEVVVIKMTATGNPDFIVIPKSLADEVRFVEVKYGKDRVHHHQQAVHDGLRRVGFRVDVVRDPNLIESEHCQVCGSKEDRCACKCTECGEELCDRCGECPDDGCECTEKEMEEFYTSNMSRTFRSLGHLAARNTARIK